MDEYAAVLRSLGRGYFWFDVASFMTFIWPNTNALPVYSPATGSMRIRDGVFLDSHAGIPQELFGAACFHLSDHYRPTAHTLQRYQEWFGQLVRAAELLQESDSTWYCSS